MRSMKNPIFEWMIALLAIAWLFDAFSGMRYLGEEGPAFQASFPKNCQAGLRIGLFCVVAPVEAEAAHRSALKIYWERGRRKDRHRRSGEQRGIERRCRSPPSRILPCMGRPGMAASTVPSIRAHGLRHQGFSLYQQGVLHRMLGDLLASDEDQHRDGERTYPVEIDMQHSGDRKSTRLNSSH